MKALALGLLSIGLLLVGCTASPAPTAAPVDEAPASIDTCDGAVFSDNIAVPMDVQASPLAELPFPLDGLVELELVCTAHLAVGYTDVDQTVDFDILVTSASLDETSAALEPSVAGAGWQRESDLVLWRDPETERYVQAIEIPEGVLVGTAAELAP